tara:strand:+ start:1399 stop:1953 length:555 start_codon:yes stop_codon:yes gene_type:complete
MAETNSEVWIGLAGVVVGASITGIKDWILEAARKKAHARYVAIRVVCLFDEFVEDTVEVAYDGGTANPHDQGCYEPNVKIPSSPHFPDHWEWKSLPPELMYEILSFPNEVKAADQEISLVGEHSAGPPYYEEWFEERQFRYAKLGKKAHAITIQLRKKYDIPKREIGNWKPEKKLERIIKEIKK